jgi:hypothetical protein
MMMIVEQSVECEFLPSFPSALQLRVSFGLLNNLPPFIVVYILFQRLIIWFLNNLIFIV